MYSVLVLFLSFVLWIASEKTLLHFRQAAGRGWHGCAWPDRLLQSQCLLQLTTAPGSSSGAAVSRGLQQLAWQANPDNVLIDSRPPAPPILSRTARRLFWYLLACAIGVVLVRWLQSLEGIGMMWVFLSAVSGLRLPHVLAAL